MFTEKDILQVKNKGLKPVDVERQVQSFINGFPFMNILKPAKLGDGILELADEELSGCIKLFEDNKPETLKFVPASGAASRMFKFLFEFYEEAEGSNDNINVLQDEQVKNFFKEIKNFAFYKELKSIINSNNLKIEELLEQRRYKEILKYFLFEEGLDYGQKPKGVLLFHNYEESVRTAFEEHLVEGALYAQNSKKDVNIHFTISPEHKSLFDELVSSKKEIYERKYNVTFKITFSVQKQSTDMVAVDLNNRLFRDDDGSLLFRPGGHGALIENLNDLDSGIIFIKNIDNIVPDSLKEETIKYKKALAGVLISYQEKIFSFINILKSQEYSERTLLEIEEFIKQKLCYDFVKTEEQGLYANYLFEILNRPIRICGMVKNEGEPGGGPFWVKHSNGTIDLQIVESLQIDRNNQKQLEILKLSTHFNPVDLICSTKNYKGERFNLLKYRDSQAGFISKKSKDGKGLKAQELPGLWNGAMAHWNTIFIEVPIITFNPVKTINDLLRTEHQ